MNSIRSIKGGSCAKNPTFLHDFHLLSIYEIIAQKFQKYNTFSGKIFVELPVQKSRHFSTRPPEKRRRGWKETEEPARSPVPGRRTGPRQESAGLDAHRQRLRGDAGGQDGLPLRHRRCARRGLGGLQAALTGGLLQGRAAQSGGAPGFRTPSRPGVRPRRPYRFLREFA